MKIIYEQTEQLTIRWPRWAHTSLHLTKLSFRSDAAFFSSFFFLLRKIRSPSDGIRIVEKASSSLHLPLQIFAVCQITASSAVRRSTNGTNATKKKYPLNAVQQWEGEKGLAVNTQRAIWNKIPKRILSDSKATCKICWASPNRDYFRSFCAVARNQLSTLAHVN